MLAKYIDFIKAHEKLVLIAAASLILLMLGNKWLDHASRTADLEVAADKAKLAAQIEANNKIQQQAEEQKAQYEKMLTVWTSQNNALLSEIRARDAELLKRQDAAKTMPLPDLAKRWIDLTKLSPNDVRFADGSLQVSEAGARSTVSELEKVPVLEQKVADGTTILSNKDGQIASLTGRITTLDSLLTGKEQEIAAGKKACEDSLSAERLNTKKAWRSGFKWGAITGFIGGLFTGRGW